MKRFSSKLMSALLVTLLIVSVIGCKSTPAPVEEVPAAAVVKPVAPAPAPVKEEAPVVEKEAPAEVMEAPKAEVTVAPKEQEVAYPYGVKEIVKAQGNDVFDLFIVHTGDVQGSLEATDSNIGYARLATMMQVARGITDNILLLDSGNATSGSDLVNFYKGETAGVLLDMLGYDAIAVGSHEFDYGLDRIRQAAQLAKEYSSVKVLSANALDAKGYLYFQPYQVYNYNGFKVGVVGLTSPDTASVKGVSFDDPMIIQNAQAAIDMAHQYVDYVVVLSSLGDTSASGYTSKTVLNNLDGVDLWVDGENQSVPAQGTRVNGALLVQSGKDMNKVGVVDVLVNNMKVVSESAFAINASDVVAPTKSALASAYGITSVPQDQKVKAYIDSMKAGLPAPKAEVMKETPAPKAEAPKAEVMKEAPAKTPEVVYPYGVKEIVKAQGNDVFDLFIVHTNDVHGRLEATDSNIGYARLATMMQVARSITDNILLLDAGDATSGSNLVNLYKGETAGVLLDMLGYDAIALGNHEFDYGLDRIRQAAQLAKEYSNVKVLSANTLDSKGYLLFQPYQVYNFNGFRVAVVGLTTPDTSVTTNPNNIKGVTFDNPMIIQNAQAAINMAHQYVDYVVVLGHFGIDENGPSGYTSKMVLENLDGIDLWIDGHSHDTLPQGERVNGALLVQTGEYMQNVGVVDVLVKNKKVVSENAFLIKASDVVDPANSPLASAYGITAVPEDPQVKAYIDSKVAELDSLYSEVLATVPMTLQGERADVRTKKTNLSQMICEAMTQSSGADFSITNGGGIRASIAAGDVTMGDVITVLPFNNVVTVVEATGAQVYEALEHGLSGLPNAAGSYVQTDLKVIYNKYAEAGKRVIRVYYNGKAISKDSTVYKVATNDFIAAGGDGYTTLTKIVAYRDLMSDVLANYLKENYPAK